MKIVDVKVSLYNNKTFRGYATIFWALTEGGNGCMIWKNCSLFEKDGQIICTLPSTKKKDDSYENVIVLKKEDSDSSALYNYMQEEVRKYYNQTVNARSGGQQQQTHPPAQNNMNGGFPNDDIPF